MTTEKPKTHSLHSIILDREWQHLRNKALATYGSDATKELRALIQADIRKCERINRANTQSFAPTE